LDREDAKMQVEESALEVSGAGVTYPGVRALTGFDIDVRAGEVHAVVGHNGSGKSTFVKLLAGQCRPTPGTRICVAGAELPPQAPLESARLGLRFVHQDLALVPSQSVTENLGLGAGLGTRSLKRIDWRAEHAAARSRLADLGYSVDPKSPVSELPRATRSAVAVARALKDFVGTPARVLVLDEVSAAMTAPEIARLLDMLARLRATGLGILYVSHHLEEVLQTADRVTVLRDGVRVATSPARTLTEGQLADLIVGTDRAHKPSEGGAMEPDGGDAATGQGRRAGPACTVTQLSGQVLRDVSFEARSGGIVGVAGIAGSGREELADLLMGSAGREGAVLIDGRELPPSRADLSVRYGMALVPADRSTNAVIPNLPIRDNMTLANLSPFWRRGWLSRRTEAKEVAAWIERLSIRGATVDGDVTTLSGGNQQKVMVARALRTRPRVLILDEPTQGIDVAAVADIHAIIRQIAETSAVIVLSSDSDELASLCSEVLVVSAGRVAARLAGSEITSSAIMRLELVGGDDGLVPTAEPEARQ
jgi:ribose transport system ATP-binding protein